MGPVPNPQLPAILPYPLLSRTLHHLAKPLYPIILLHVSPISRPPVTSRLMFSNRSISVTSPRLWNDLPPELRTISLPPSSSLPITNHHLHPAPLSITPRLSN